MIGPMPKFMGTEEWEKYKAHGYDIPYFNFRLKHGAPEWLQKEFKEYRDMHLKGRMEEGIITKQEYEESIKKSIFLESDD